MGRNLMIKKNEWSLDNGITIAEIDTFPEEIYRTQLEEHLMGEYPMLPWREHLSENDVAKIKALRDKVQNRYDLRLALLDGDKLIGWSYGWQDVFDHSSFFMGASMVLQDYRRRGLYSELVKKVFEITKEVGFQSIWSTHVMTNNPVIIAKMRLGFTITGFESNVNYGNLVKLTYHHSDLRRRAAKFRAGAIGETEVLNMLLKSNQNNRMC